MNSTNQFADGLVKQQVSVMGLCRLLPVTSVSRDAWAIPVGQWVESRRTKMAESGHTRDLTGWEQLTSAKSGPKNRRQKHGPTAAEVTVVELWTCNQQGNLQPATSNQEGHLLLPGRARYFPLSFCTCPFHSLATPVQPATLGISTRAATVNPTCTQTTHSLRDGDEANRQPKIINTLPCNCSLFPHPLSLFVQITPLRPSLLLPWFFTRFLLPLLVQRREALAFI